MYDQERKKILLTESGYSLRVRPPCSVICYTLSQCQGNLTYVGYLVGSPPLWVAFRRNFVMKYFKPENVKGLKPITKPVLGGPRFVHLLSSHYTPLQKIIFSLGWARTQVRGNFSCVVHDPKTTRRNPWVSRTLLTRFSQETKHLLRERSSNVICKLIKPAHRKAPIGSV